MALAIQGFRIATAEGAIPIFLLPTYRVNLHIGIR